MVQVGAGLFKRRSGAGMGVGGQGSVKADQGFRCRYTHGFMLLPLPGAPETALGLSLNGLPI
jgi:hypothetical protein